VQGQFGDVPSQTETNAFADAMSTSYGAPMELFSVDPLNGTETVLADTSITNLLAELPVLETLWRCAVGRERQRGGHPRRSLGGCGRRGGGVRDCLWWFDADDAKCRWGRPGSPPAQRATLPAAIRARF
jgi:hypothetical protein